MDELNKTWKQKLRPLYENTPFFDFVMTRRGKAQRDEWLKGNKQTPTPQFVKENALIDAGKRFGPKILIETGTYRGDMLFALRNHFRDLYSIELHPGFHARAQKRFRRLPHIHPLQGDSGQRLGELLKTIKEPCLFWLDGHYSGNITARTTKDTPIVEEIIAIGAHPIKNHVVLIDDAHCFDGTHDYPTIEGLREIAAKHMPTYDYKVEDGIIYLLPKRS